VAVVGKPVFVVRKDTGDKREDWRSEALADSKRMRDADVLRCFQAILPLAPMRVSRITRALEAEGMSWGAASRAARWLRWVAREIADAPGVQA